MATGAGCDVGDAEFVGDLQGLAEFGNTRVADQVGVTGQADGFESVFGQQFLDVGDFLFVGVAANVLGPAGHGGQLNALESGAGNARQCFFERIGVITVG